MPPDPPFNAILSAPERSFVIMRVAKILVEIVEAKVLESLRSRMDSATRRVYPRWKLANNAFKVEDERCDGALRRFVV